VVDHEPTAVRAVVLDLDDTVVAWQSLPHWQWAWKPNGPVLPERRVRSVLHRAQHRWDRLRWHAYAETQEQTPAPVLADFLGSTLHEIAGRSLPAEEAQAVVRRFLSSVGGVEAFADARPLIDRVAASGRPCHIATYLPKEVASGALRRAGLPTERLISWGDEPDVAPFPSRAAFRVLVTRLGVPARSILYVGDLFWSDYRAAARSGLTAVWLDRERLGERTGATRVTDLKSLEPWLETSAVAPPSPPGNPPPPPAGEDS
jgi:FMN phosphatase YigB (HAD superfamily)